MVLHELPNASLPFEPYDRLREIEPDLYCIDGDWRGSPLRRRMTIMRTRAHELVIHNPIRLEEDHYLELERLGFIAHVVAPNRFHRSELAFYQKRFPLAAYHLPGTGGLWPMAIRKEVDCIAFEGTRLIDEAVFFHPVSRTLVVTDLVFNFQGELEGFDKFLLQTAGIYRKFGPSRLFRFACVSDRSAARHSLRRILQWDFDRIVMNHGSIVERDGRKKLYDAFAAIGIDAR